MSNTDTDRDHKKKVSFTSQDQPAVSIGWTEGNAITRDGYMRMWTIRHHLLTPATSTRTSVHACMAAAPATSSNNGGLCHFIVSTNTNKTVDSADGAKKQIDNGLMRERKPFCWNWWHVQMETMAPLLKTGSTLERVCLSLLGPYVLQCVCVRICVHVCWIKQKNIHCTPQTVPLWFPPILLFLG